VRESRDGHETSCDVQAMDLSLRRRRGVGVSKITVR